MSVETDSAAAKFRMRRLRAQQGGQTVYDRARNYATRKTLEQHKGTFHLYRLEYLNRHRARRGEKQQYDVGSDRRRIL